MPWLVSKVTSSFVCSKVVGVEPCDAGKGQVLMFNSTSEQEGSLTQLKEMEGEPFKAEWFLKVNYGL